MFTISKPKDNRVDLDVSGSIDSEAMRTALDDLISASEGIKHGRMLYRIPDMAWPTLGASSVELVRLPALFALLKKFDRCAVLTDATWIKTAAELEGALLPGLEIKAFSLSQTSEAEAWLAQTTT